MQRERRAAIARAEGDKRAVELAADARLYEAKRASEATRVAADADAYAIKAQAEADAEQTRVVAEAIRNDGQPAIDYEVMKRQVEALASVAASGNSKTVIIPSDIARAFGSLDILIDQIRSNSGVGRS